jgi:hypothetical protein
MTRQLPVRPNDRARPAYRAVQQLVPANEAMAAVSPAFPSKLRCPEVSRRRRAVRLVMPSRRRLSGLIET